MGQRRVARAFLLVAVGGGLLSTGAPARAAANFTISPTSGPVGSSIHVTGSGCPPSNPQGDLTFTVVDGPGRGAPEKANTDGTFAFDYVVPSPRAGEQTSDGLYDTDLFCNSNQADATGPRFKITGPTFTLTPASAAPGAQVTIHGQGCQQDGDGSQDARLSFDGTPLTTFKANDDQSFTLTFTVPASATVGAHQASINCLDQPLDSPSGPGGQRLTGSASLHVTAGSAAGQSRFLALRGQGLALINQDGTGARTVADRASFGQLSPKGDAVAIQSFSQTSPDGVFSIFDLTTKRTRQGPLPDTLADFSWSPSGSELAGIRYPLTNGSHALVVRSASARQEQALVTEGQQFGDRTAGVIVSGTDWGLASDEIIFTFGFQRPSGRESGIYAVSRTKPTDIRVIASGPFNAGQYTFARFSPDGRAIAYLKTPYQAGGPCGAGDHTALRTVNADGSDDRLVADLGICDSTGQPVWAPSGDTIAISAPFAQAGPLTTRLFNATTGVATPTPAALDGSTVLQWVAAAPSPLPRTGASAASSSSLKNVAPSRALTDAAARAAHRSGRSPLAVALRTPDTISTKVRLLLVNLLLAVGLALLVFPAVLFNSTYEEHYDEVNGWFRRTPRPKQPRPRTHWRKRWAGFVAVAAATALLASLLDPKLKADRATVLLVVGVAAATVATTVLAHVVSRLYLRETHGHIKSYPGGVAVGAVTVGVSRVVHFLPGYLYGIVGGFDEEPAAEKARAGRAAVIGQAWGLVLGVGAWFAWQPVAHRAARHHASAGLAVVDAVLASVAALSFEGLLFSMIPVKPLPGETLWKWNRAAWAIFMTIGAFSFLYVLAHPASKYTGSVTVMLVLFAAFGFASLTFWGYFRWRKPKAPVALAPPVTAPAARPRRERPLRAPGREPKGD